MKETSPGTYSLCAVVPAAGRGSRLGANVPKVFVPLFPGYTIWDAIHDQLLQVADRIVLVLSPEGVRFLETSRADLATGSFARTEVAGQSEPRGMGDAIFGAAEFWRGAKNLLVVWGDQFNLSADTLRACMEMHALQKGPALTLPLVRMERPYVEYVFDSDHLMAVRQSREGDACAPNGLADIGVFLLSGGDCLVEEWTHYRSIGEAGPATGEINFLPFLVYLSSVAGWAVARYECRDPEEALGINTPEDLVLARGILRRKDPDLHRDLDNA